MRCLTRLVAFVAMFTLVLGICPAGAAVPYTPPTSGMEPVEVTRSQVVLLADQGVQLGRDVALHGGDIAVRKVAEQPFLHPKRAAEADLGRGVSFTDDTSRIHANRLYLGRDAQIHDVFVNKIDVARGARVGNVHQPLSLPLDVALPSAPSPGPGGPDIRVERGETLELPPGSYGEVAVDRDAMLVLTGGNYHLSALNLARDTQLRFREPAIVKVAGRVTMKRHVNVGPTADAGDLDASDLRLATASVTPPGLLGSSAAAVDVGRDSDVVATVEAPLGHVELGRDVAFRGSVAARWIVVGRGVDLTHVPAGADDHTPPEATHRGVQRASTRPNDRN